MPAETNETKALDPGLVSLVILLRCHGIGAEAEQIRHRCGTPKIGITEMLRCGKEILSWVSGQCAGVVW